MKTIQDAMGPDENDSIIKIGKVQIYWHDNKLWIVGKDGDCGTFPEKDFEAVIQKFFDKHF